MKKSRQRIALNRETVRSLTGPLPRAALIASLMIASILAIGAGDAFAQAPFVRTIIVNSGSSPGANGNALLIALSNITTNSSTNPWLIKIEPGLYDLGAGSLTMKDYVDMEGSGRDVTTITSTQPRASNMGVINIPSATHAELRDLTVQNTNNTYDAIGLTNISDNFLLSRVNVVVPNGIDNTFGILTEAASPKFNQVSVQLTASGNLLGIYVTGGSPAMRDVTISCQGTGSVASVTGFVIVGGRSTIDRAIVTLGGGGVTSYGASISNGAIPLISNSVFTVTGGSGSSVNEGIRSFGSITTLQDLNISVSGGAYDYGIVVDGGGYNTLAPSVVRRSVIGVSGASTDNFGVYLDHFGNATLRELDVQASGGSQAAAVFADYLNGGSSGQTLTIADSSLQATAGATNIAIETTGGTTNTFTIVRTNAVASTGTSYGLSAGAYGNTFTIDHSQISGGTGSVHTDPSSPFTAGASQLAGAVGPGAGTCVASYNGSYAALSASCN